MKRELLTVLEIGGAVALGLGAFNKAQRQWILDRDGNKCKAPFKHTEDTEHPLEVHHVLPQRYGKVVGLEEETLDVPQNAVTLCRAGHDVIHPDRVSARQTYHQAKQNGQDTFKELMSKRGKKLEQKQVYWNTEHDRAMQVVALRQTQKVDASTFPKKKPKKPVL